MKAASLKGAGGVENFEIIDLPIPDVGNDEVLVKVKAFSINPVDIKTRSGKALYSKIKDEKPLILGWDISGVVSKTGNKDFKEGDEVFGMVNFPGHGKAYAEYVAAPASHLAHKPENVSFEEAAATTLAALTAWQDLTDKANLQSGQKILIHGASGGVGHYAVQMAKHKGATVVGTSSAENRDFVLGLGADEHIDYKNQRFEDEVSEVDVVLDTIGSENSKRSLQVLKKGGLLMSIVGGVNDEVKEMADEKDIRGINCMVSSNGDDMKTLAELLEKNIMKVHISKTYSFNELDKAHEQVASGHTTGKVVVTI